MTQALIALAVSFVLTLVIGRFLIPELRKLKAGQEIREDGPTWHKSKAGTPTMGGIMFILGGGVTVFVLGWDAMLRGSFVHLYVYLFALIFGIIGFVDDYRKVRQHQNEGLTAKQKFVLQLAAAVVFLCLMRYEGLLSNALYIPFANVTVTVNWIVYLVFAAFVIVGCVNAVNLTDGIDGLACSVTFVVMVFFTVTGTLWSAQDRQGLFPAALAGGLAAFFVYNHHPAKVFMGDTGSLFLGGAVAALAFAMDMPLILILVGIIYIAETMSDIIQVTYFKATHGKRFFKMAPLHHHLELSGWSEAKLVAVFSGITLVFCALAFLGVQGRL
ncbi:MAG: phospho-N-acetylmuramoyl-pentapeptide-transferase [Dysosmobacter sp.]|uniref:phospho-N-acetylmuramoyl-pentapeptide- transferase n=1 Tax=Dysosmobacter sp. TaxID=2591382 RepID=UPI00283BA582|nr:phospho-N-acetylmuramoyl-pentapeptide-transferase [Dysosmobacter sp.]MDR3983670.1 phospho-N-acetylmuramoyl-pentapeptide-transferase [Dysosmobacter sp.]